MPHPPHISSCLPLYLLVRLPLEGRGDRLLQDLDAPPTQSAQRHHRHRWRGLRCGLRRVRRNLACKLHAARVESFLPSLLPSEIELVERDAVQSGA